MKWLGRHEFVTFSILSWVAWAFANAVAPLILGPVPSGMWLASAIIPAYLTLIAFPITAWLKKAERRRR